MEKPSDPPGPGDELPEEKKADLPQEKKEGFSPSTPSSSIKKPKVITDMGKEFDYFFSKLRKIDLSSIKLAFPFGKKRIKPLGKTAVPISPETVPEASSALPGETENELLPKPLKKEKKKKNFLGLPFKLPIKIFFVWGIAIAVCIVVIKQLFFVPDEKLKKTQDAKAAEQKQQEEAAKEEIFPAKVFKVARFNYEDSLNALGNIKGGVEFKLSFEIPGIVNSINYREGERYEEGALLISLKQDDILIRLKKTQAEKNKSETALSIAKEKFDEHNKLYKLGSVPQTTVDKVRLEVDSAQYDVESNELEVKMNEAMLEKSNLYAPSDGMIGELYIEEGETVTPNSLIGSHVSTEVVFAEFGVTERDVSKLALGQKARVYVDAYPDKTFEGVVENIAPVVTGSSRTSTSRVRMENPDGFLLPGMFARIKILLYNKRNALVVPTDSVQGKGDESSVWIVDPRTNKVAKRNLKIGYTRPDYSQVDAGLEEGELVVVSGLEKMEEGMQVKVLEQQEVTL